MLTLGLGGCAYPEVTARLPIPHAPTFSDSGDVERPDRWWTAFEDSALNHQIDLSLDGNFTLEAAWERLRAARALAQREASDLWPDLDGIAEADGTVRTAGQNDSRFALGVDASYELDLWDRIESRVEAESLRASATLADFHTAALTLSAEVARAWFTLIEAHAQLELVNEQTETNLKVLEVLETRFALGQIRSADVLRQRQLVEATREQAVIGRARIDVLEHLLAVLQGQAPQDASYAPGTMLPALPPLPDTGLPAELLNRRPDVLRDYLELQAADRDLASAVSAQYPRINLTGSVTTAVESPERLFQEWIASITGQLIAPLLDGGERRAEVHRTAAIVRERFAAYGQTVLTAYREVEDALTVERHQVERIESLDTQLKLARLTSGQLRQQYLNGVTDYIAVLAALVEEQRLQRETMLARLELVLTRVALYLALAGDFQGVGFECCPPTRLIGDPVPENLNDERSPETATEASLASHFGQPDHVPVDSQRGRRGDRDDQQDRTDGAAGRSDAEVRGAGRDDDG